jgi:hypothetical protein
MIYVASSWRNTLQQGLVKSLRDLGCWVYDFKNPAPGVGGFQWSAIDPDWENWGPDQLIEALDHPLSEQGFGLDFDAMHRANRCALLLPCGRSAHIEGGWMKGAGKQLDVILAEGCEPELMIKMADTIHPNPEAYLAYIERLKILR